MKVYTLLDGAREDYKAGETLGLTIKIREDATPAQLNTIYQEAFKSIDLAKANNQAV